MLFGKTSLNMAPSALVIVGVLSPLSGILGSLVWPMLQRRLLWSNLKIVIVLVILCSLIPAYGCMGFVFQGRTKFGGLTSQGEMFGLAVYFGDYIALLTELCLMSRAVYRVCVWRFSRLRKGFLCGIVTSWGGSAMVRQIKHCQPSVSHLPL